MSFTGVDVSYVVSCWLTMGCVCDRLLDFKTRAAWESSFATFDDVASEAMKDCIARVYEPSVLRIVDDRRIEPEPEPERLFFDDEDPASESITADREDILEGRNFFRFSVWKAQNLPPRVDGTPHTWIVQAKYGKSILTSSSKTDNDPVWKVSIRRRRGVGCVVMLLTGWLCRNTFTSRWG